MHLQAATRLALNENQIRMVMKIANILNCQE